MNTTEKYIKKAVSEAVSEAKKELAGNTIKNCNIQMDMQADGATQILAEAMLEQAGANKASSEAMSQLARTLKPIEVCAIKISNGEMKGFEPDSK